MSSILSDQIEVLKIDEHGSVWYLGEQIVKEHFYMRLAHDCIGCGAKDIIVSLSKIQQTPVTENSMFVIGSIQNYFEFRYMSDNIEYALTFHIDDIIYSERKNLKYCMSTFIRRQETKDIIVPFMSSWALRNLVRNGKPVQLPLFLNEYEDSKNVCQGK